MGLGLGILGDALNAWCIHYAIKNGSVPNKDYTKTVLKQGVDYFDLAIKYCAFLGSKKVKFENINMNDAGRIFDEIASIKSEFMSLNIEQFVDELKKYKSSLEKLVNNEEVDLNSKKILLDYFDKLRDTGYLERSMSDRRHFDSLGLAA